MPRRSRNIDARAGGATACAQFPKIALGAPDGKDRIEAQGLRRSSAIGRISRGRSGGIGAALLHAIMSASHRLRFYGYVDRPYEAVRSLLRSSAQEVLQRATNTASERARGIVARLHVDAAGMDVGVDIRVEVERRPEDAGVAGLPPVTHLALSWKSAKEEGLFPSMSADLALSPMTSAETRIEFDGTYHPPLAAFGKAFDAVMGHRIAEASVHRFVNDAIEELRRELPKASG
jgi:hypothetical protein